MTIRNKSEEFEFRASTAQKKRDLINKTWYSTIHCMGISFEDPPLAELIAEVRWGAALAVPFIGQPSGSLSMNRLTGRNDEFFGRFGSRVAKEGFGQSERLIPQAFPVFPSQPVYRYRKIEQEKGTALYQLGAGVFSANVTPPYQSWTAFEPMLRAGVKALLEAREEGDIPLGVAVRYINIFTGVLRQDRSIASFMADVLDIKIHLHPSLERIVAKGEEAKPHLQLTIPVTEDYQLLLNIGEGIVSSQQGIVMDISVSNASEIQPSEEALMEKLNGAHDIIQDIFVDMTKPLHPIMKKRPT